MTTEQAAALINEVRAVGLALAFGVAYFVVRDLLRAFSK